MPEISAGILLFRKKGKRVEFLLVHPGGPFFKYKDKGVWSIPKGTVQDESKLHGAKREFKEETGGKVTGGFISLSPQKLKSGKVIFAWASEGNFEPSQLKSNKSKFGWPEVDKAEWFDEKSALEKINPGQSGFITELVKKQEG